MQMRTSLVAALLAGTLVGGAAGFCVDRAHAENLVIVNQGRVWKHGSIVKNPIVVPARKGDVIEVKVTGTHNFVTLDKPGDQAPSFAMELVLACGEDAKAKPNHVLREVECGTGGSQLNPEAPLGAPMKLEVLDKLQSEVHFWCNFHQEMMWGTIKPKP
jgi:hypothetical protein